MSAHTPELKPCPFCGNQNLCIQGNGIGDYYVICGDGDELGCGARSDDFRCESKEYAAKRWNRRTADVAENAKLREINGELLEACMIARKYFGDSTHPLAALIRQVCAKAEGR